MAKKVPKGFFLQKSFFSLLFWALFFISAFCISTLVILKVRGHLLPQTPTVKSSSKLRKSKSKPKQKQDYSQWLLNNPFHQEEMPLTKYELQKAELERLGQKGPDDEVDEEIDDSIRKTSLPINLLGTMVLVNAKRSVATINIRGESKNQLVRVGQDVPKIGEVLEIHRKALIFRNYQSELREYIEIPEHEILKEKTPVATKRPPRVKTSSKRPGPPDDGGDIKVKRDGNKFEISREEIDKQMANIDTLLKSAKAIPYTIDGQIQGFRLISIRGGSIFSKLGFKRGDIVTEVNGIALDSVNKGIELFNQFKTADKVDVKVKRSGKEEEFSFNVNS